MCAPDACGLIAQSGRCAAPQGERFAASRRLSSSRCNLGSAAPALADAPCRPGFACSRRRPRGGPAALYAAALMRATLEERYVAAGRSAWPRTSCVDVGRSEGTQALPAASRVDGRRVRRSSFSSTVCARPGTRSLRPSRSVAAANGSRRATGSPTTSPDLEALIDAFAPAETGESGGPQPRRECRDDVCGCAAGPRATNRLARGIRHPGAVARCRAREDRGVARRARLAAGIYALYASFDAVADRLQKNNPRLPRKQGRYSSLAPLGGDRRRLARGSCPIPVTSCRFRPPTDSTKRLPYGARSPRRRCGLLPRNRRFRKWLNDRPGRQGQAPTGSTAFGAAMAPSSATPASLSFPDAGHMLHHDRLELDAAAAIRGVPDLNNEQRLAVPDPARSSGVRRGSRSRSSSGP